jgi:hypothetical protein
MNRLLITVAVVAIVAAGLAFTKPGHNVLARFGLAAACSSSEGCD